MTYFMPMGHVANHDVYLLLPSSSKSLSNRASRPAMFKTGVDHLIRLLGFNRIAIYTCRLLHVD